MVLLAFKNFIREYLYLHHLTPPSYPSNSSILPHLPLKFMTSSFNYYCNLPGM